MGFYQQGLQQGSLLRSNYHVGAIVATPSAIKEEAARLNADVETMAAELAREQLSWTPPGGTARPPTPEQEVMARWFDNVWLPFVRDWDKWFGDHGRTWGLRNIFENFWGSSWDAVQEYRAKLLDLRRSATQAGFPFIGPTPAQPKVGPFGEGSGLWSAVRTLFWVAVFVAGGFMVLRFIEVTR